MDWFKNLRRLLPERILSIELASIISRLRDWLKDARRSFPESIQSSEFASIVSQLIKRAREAIEAIPEKIQPFPDIPLVIDTRFVAWILFVILFISSAAMIKGIKDERAAQLALIGQELGSAFTELEGGDPFSLGDTRQPSLPSPAISTRIQVETTEPIVPAPGAGSTVASTGETQSFIPVVSGGGEPTRTPTPTASPTTKPTSTPGPVLPQTPVPTPTPTIDFGAVRQRLQDVDRDLGFAKIGFHTAVGGNRTGIGEWMRRLDEAGVPFFLKSADDAGPLFDAQQIIKDSDVPHTLVYRRSGDEYDTPDYNLPPVESARQHWQLHKDAFPSELDPEIVWIETINEVDKERSEWLGYFAIETARLALDDGYRWAAFGWSSGEPEVTDWTSPSMLEFLRFAGDFPDGIAIALHEYSYINEDIAHEYPFKVGRFQQLFDVVDRYDIPRPTVLVTEWGWEYDDVPSIDVALRDIEWAAAMYAPFPEIAGAAIWYLGDGYGAIAEKVQRFIVPVTEYSLGNYFAIPLPPDVAPIDPEQFRPR